MLKRRNFTSFLYWPIDMWCCVPSSRFDEFDFLLCIIRAYSRPAHSQWETSLQSNVVSHWLGSNLESTLIMLQGLIATATPVKLKLVHVVYAVACYIYSCQQWQFPADRLVFYISSHIQTQCRLYPSRTMPCHSARDYPTSIFPSCNKCGSHLYLLVYCGVRIYEVVWACSPSFWHRTYEYYSLPY